MVMRACGVYIVRIWLEPSSGTNGWRAAVTDTVTKERHYFTQPEALSEFLSLSGESLPPLDAAGTAPAE